MYFETEIVDHVQIDGKGGMKFNKKANSYMENATFIH